MNSVIKTKWLAALRSGDFRQGKGRLRDTDNKYCCLGILCELAVQEGVIPPPIISYDVYQYGDFSTGSLPYQVQKWAELDSQMGKYNNRSLAHDNDDGASFEEIALIIEEKF